MTGFNKKLLFVIIVVLVICGFFGAYKIGFSDGVSSVDDKLSKIQEEWLHKTVVATGDYFDSNGTKFRGEVVGVTVRSWGTFITVYNGSTGMLYPDVRTEYFNQIQKK